MARDIYDEFDAATRGIEAWAILKDGALIGKVVKKISKSGLQVTAYVHIFETNMAKGIARGGGYDRMSAAVEHAVKKIPAAAFPVSETAIKNLEDIKEAMRSARSGHEWSRTLENIGLRVRTII